MKEEFKRDRTVDMINRKEKKAQFNTDLNKAEKEEIDKVLNDYEISKAEFVRKAFKNLKEELKMKKYVVTIEQEYFVKGGAGYPYKYQHLTDKYDNVYFDTLKEAKNYINEYKLTYDLSQSSLYVDTLSVFEVDEDNEIVSENLYSLTYDIDTIKKEENIEIKY